MGNDVTLGEKNLKSIKETLNKLVKKIESNTDQLKTLDNLNKKIVSENAIKLEDLKVLLNKKSSMELENNSLGSLLDTAKRECDTEERERQSLLTRYRTVEHEYMA